VHYEIRVKGVLDSGWSAWFDGLRVTSDQHDQTVIAGPVADQAALHGLLAPGWLAGLAVAHRSPGAITPPDVKAGRTEGQDAHDAAVGAGGWPAPTARAS
jgi:hypothetical protein